MTLAIGWSTIHPSSARIRKQDRKRKVSIYRSLKVPKIIQVGIDKVTVGFENGSLRDFDRASCSGFVPQIGMRVEVYESGGRTMIVQPQNAGAAAGGAAFSSGGAAGQQQSGSSVSQLAYCVLALLLGGFGVHKFYAGHIGLGILYLLFFWTGIPAIVGFVEFILALLKKPDANGRIVV